MLTMECKSLPLTIAMLGEAEKEGGRGREEEEEEGYDQLS